MAATVTPSPVPHDVDVATLRRLLDGEHAEIRDGTRAWLSRPGSAPRPVHGGENEHGHHRIEEAALHVAERAWLQAARVLQVVAEAEQRRANGGAGGEARSPGEFLDHEGRILKPIFWQSAGTGEGNPTCS